MQDSRGIVISSYLLKRSKCDFIAFFEGEKIKLYLHEGIFLCCKFPGALFIDRD